MDSIIVACQCLAIIVLGLIICIPIMLVILKYAAIVAKKIGLEEMFEKWLKS